LEAEYILNQYKDPPKALHNLNMPYSYIALPVPLLCQVTDWLQPISEIGLL
jgi:hypothetical protein